MSKPKTPDTTFTEKWNKAVSWAQTQGISPDSYIPVYQADQQRLANAYTPMSAAETHVAIQAAHNPNNVPSAPTDNPRPSNVFGNARHDLAMVATGLEPSHLLGGLFDTVKNTVEAVANPGREHGPNLGTTAANWLQNTLLSFIPGAYDIGTVLKADPTLSGDAGFKALASHPLISLLDLLPLKMGKVAAATAIGRKLGEAAGMSKAQLAESGVTRTFMRAMSNRPAGMGIKAGSAAEGFTQITRGDKIQTWLQNSRLGASAPVQHFVREWFTNNQLHTSIFQNMLVPALDAFNALKPEEQSVFNDILQRHQFKGEDLQTLMNDPKVTPPIREAINKYVEGPLKWKRENAIAMEDVAAVQRPDGSQALYSSKQHPEVLRTRDDLMHAYREFVPRLDKTDALFRTITQLDEAMPKLATELEGVTKGARDFANRDESMLENVREEYTPPGTTKLGKAKKKEYLTFGKKRDSALALFGPGGLSSKVSDALREGREDQASALIDVLDSRLQRWYYQSVDAAEHPAFQAVADQVSKLKQLMDNRKKMWKEVGTRIEGEAGVVSRETAEDAARSRKQKDELYVRQVEERRQFGKRQAAAIATQRAAGKVKVENLNHLYQSMKAAAEYRAANAAELATEAQRALNAASLRREVEAETKSWQASVRAAKAESAAAEEKIRRQFEQEKPKLKTQQEAEAVDLAEIHANSKLFHGQNIEYMRSFTDTMKEFQQAVWDHPTDDLRNVQMEVYMNSLMDSMRNSELLQKSLKSDLKRSNIDEAAFTDALHTNPTIIRELFAHFVDDVYTNPDNFTPDLVDAVHEAKADATQDGRDEANKLIAEGHAPMWMPQARSLDTQGASIKALIGHGEPSVDVALKRANSLVAIRHDAVLGVTKAMAQSLERDAHIAFVEHSITPRVATGRDLATQMKGMVDLHGFDGKIGTLTDAFDAEMRRAGLTRFDSKALFGFSPPRWEGEATYMPTGLVTAIKKVQKMETEETRGLFDKTNQVFRYSILGLSPRYTAHILFGGTFLLAVRSSVLMPTIILKAAKAMREGNIDDLVFRQPAQEGFGRLNYTLHEHARLGGQQLSLLAIQEHVEKTQNVLLSKASPFHYLKAAADINFRFTRYATRMQSAIAYFDYMSRAERRGYFTDEETGQVMHMTKERAMKEGMQHVLDVFGDLRSMAPIERQVAKNILPFYGWTRHIIKYVLTMPVDHPWRAMVLALLAYENSAEVPKGLPERIQFLFFLGSPDKQGNVSAVDTRFMDPLRDVANYASLGGWIQGLNPALLAPLAMMNPQFVYGSNTLYPNLTYNDMYGIETAGSQGNVVTGLQQFTPQLGALSSALSAAFDARSQAQTDPQAFSKNLFNSLNIPFAQLQTINVKQIAAHDAIARYAVAENTAKNAFQSGDFSTLSGYAKVPYPLNPDYEITPEALQQIYNQAMAAYPGQQPQNVLLPPPPPAGY